MTDFDEEEPLASWEAAFLPDWEWEAYDKVEDEDGLYFGRVKSPNTYDKWEYGYFNREQLEKAGAYRTDQDLEDDTPLFPDGGTPEDFIQIYETELEALLEYREED